jgi:ABC-type dipeptide/oligopeptide/nickel transport system permease subunit
VQNTVLLTVVAMLTGALPIGVSLGLMSGYFGGKVDSLIMRAGEIAAVFPEFFLVIIIASTMGPRIRNWVIWLEDNSGIVDYLIVAAALVVLVAFGLPRLLGRRILPLRADNIVILLALVTFGWFGIALLGDSQVVSLDGLVTSGAVDYVVISVALVSFGWIGLARLVRGQILYLKGFQHVEAARAVGASTPRIMFLHLLPNAISPIVVNVSMGMGVFIGTEIFLSWIGLGIQPPRPSLGRMLLEAGNIGTLQNEPWMLLAPGFVAWLLVLSWNLLGDALNDVLNPRTR